MAAKKHQELKKIDQMKIVDLKPYKYNAKLHPKSQIEGIAESIRRFGFVQPIVVDRNNEVIIGHGRLEAAKLLELETVPVLRLEDLASDDVRALRLIDNKIAETGWDRPTLDKELGDLHYDFETFNLDFSLPDIGIDMPEDPEPNTNTNKTNTIQFQLKDDLDYEVVSQHIDDKGKAELIQLMVDHCKKVEND